MTSRLTKVAGGLRPRMRIPDRASDAQTALLRYLGYGVVPAWFIPGLLDGISIGAAGLSGTQAPVSR
jgi:hypothetical protein